MKKLFLTIILLMIGNTAWGQFNSLQEFKGTWEARMELDDNGTEASLPHYITIDVSSALMPTVVRIGIYFQGDTIRYKMLFTLDTLIADKNHFFAADDGECIIMLYSSEYELVNGLSISYYKLTEVKRFKWVLKRRISSNPNYLEEK